MYGHSPVDITMLAPGEYRVTVALEGYRDDHRVVTVSPGRDVAIRIEMARSTAEEAAAAGDAGDAGAAAEVDGGGLGTGAILGIVGAGAAAGVGVAVAGGGGDPVGPAPTPDPRPAPSAPSAPSAPRLEAGDGELTVRWTGSGEQRRGHRRLRRSLPADRRCVEVAAGWGEEHGDDGDDHGSDERHGVRGSGSGREFGWRRPVVGERDGDAGVDSVAAVGAVDAEVGGWRW